MNNNPYPKYVRNTVAIPVKPQPAVSDERTNDEPVAWMCSDESLVRKGYSRFSRNCEGDWNIPVYTRPQPAAQFAGSYGTIDESAAKRIATALGWKPAAPQRSEDKKQWVGLTNKEIYYCEPKTDWYDSVEFARAIEAKLKEKNT